MSRLHFQPIKGKSLEIIDAILHTEEASTVGDFWGYFSVVVEELVLNIVDYSHSEYLDIEILRDEKSITLRIHDAGMPFNPLEREMPDLTLPMEERPIGGLGIFMVIKYMDSITYDYAGGENILTLAKNLTKTKAKR